MKKVLLSVVCIVLVQPLAFAEVPDPAFCEVQPADALNGGVGCPQSPSPILASVNTVVVRNSAGNPLPGTTVVFESGPTGLNACPSSVFTGVTDVNGEVTITLGFGGCIFQLPAG